VLALSEQAQVEETREIAEAIDPHPILSYHQVELTRWIAERYLSSYFDAAALMLPPGFERRVLTFFQPSPKPSELASSSLTAQQQKLLTVIESKGRLELRQLKKMFSRDKVDTIIEQLLRKGLVIKNHELERIKVRPRLVSYLRLAVTANKADELIAALEQKRATQQAKLLRLLATKPGPVPLSEARRKLSFTPTPFRL
jgi:primosomal protein N' (replication factor Y)